MDWIDWVIIGLVIAIVVAIAVIFVIKLCKMPQEERQKLIIEFLIGLVTIAENAYNGKGLGKDKIAWVEQRFNATAPWFLKIVLMFTKSKSLEDLIGEALKKAKETEWDKYKKQQ